MKRKLFIFSNSVKINMSDSWTIHASEWSLERGVRQGEEAGGDQNFCQNRRKYNGQECFD